MFYNYDFYSNVPIYIRDYSGKINFKSLFFALYPLIYGRSLVEFLFNTREPICLVSDRSKPPVSLSRFLSPHAKPRLQSDGEQMTFDVGK